MLFRNADLARLAEKQRTNVYRDYDLPEPDDNLVGTREDPLGPPVYTEATVIAWCDANGIVYDLGRVLK